MTEVSRFSPHQQYALPHEPGQRTDGMAIAAFVVVFFASVVGLVVGLVLGYVALSRIRSTHERGRGLALAAVVLGWVGTGGFLLLIVLFVVGSWMFTIF